MDVADVCAVLERNAIDFALIGGHAVAARGFPRATTDVDFLTTDRRALDPSVWRDLTAAGAKVNPIKGDFDDPLGGVTHITLPSGTDVDIVVGKYKWEAKVVERAELMEASGLRVRVPRTADLILLKVAAGGYLDLRDAQTLLEVGDRAALVDEIDSRIPELPRDVQKAWNDLRGAQL